MTSGWRTIRVFISSTFRDMQAERDHLVRFVFPRLRETLSRRRMHLVDVDLRWGVTADQSALDLCLDEIDRCQPRFLCMLGGRYGWVPPGRTESITASEVVYGALDKLEEPRFRFFCFRDPTATASVLGPEAADYREPSDSDAARALDSLKHRVRTSPGQTLVAPGVVETLPVPVLDYQCTWDDTSKRFVDLDAFGAAVFAWLLASVDAEFGTADDQPADEFVDEHAAMDAFAETRSERYVIGSRQPVFDQLEAHARGRDGSGWLLIVGEAGSGKSALLSWFWREWLKDGSGRPADQIVIAHFVGASAASTSVRRLLRRLCHELGAELASNEPLPDEPEKLRDLLATRLREVAERQSVLLIVDALNQIEGDGSASVMWLPEALPTGVRMIGSLLPGKTLDALHARRSSPTEIVLDPLTANDGTAIIESFRHRYRKTLDASQQATLLAKRDAGRPLYLLTALEELRTLGTYEEISARIREMPETIEALFDWILSRLEGDQGFRDADRRVIGPSVVRAYCSFLAAGRVGMTEAELAELAAPGVDASGADALGNVAALQRLLRPYLMRRGPLLDFFHGQLRTAVEARYFHDAVARRAVHQQAAEYFTHKADPSGDRTWSSRHERALSELPFHQTEAELWDDVHATLTDLGFLEAKCTHVAALTSGTGADERVVYNGVYELQDDYRRALERMPVE